MRDVEQDGEGFGVLDGVCDPEQDGDGPVSLLTSVDGSGLDDEVGSGKSEPVGVTLGILLGVEEGDLVGVEFGE